MSHSPYNKRVENVCRIIRDMQFQTDRRDDVSERPRVGVKVTIDHTIWGELPEYEEQDAQFAQDLIDKALAIQV